MPDRWGDTYRCDAPNCGREITFGVFKFTISRYKTALCFQHQKEWDEKNDPPWYKELKKKKQGIDK